MREDKGCESCYYKDFHPNAYPCSRCIRNAPNEDMWQSRAEANGSVYRCFNCGEMAVGWYASFTFEDCGYMGDGIVHMCKCRNCGAEIEYRIRLDEDED